MATPRQTTAGSSLVILVAIVLILVAIYFINMGVTLYLASNDLLGSLIYLGVGVVSLSLVGMTVMRMRRGYGTAGVHARVLSVVLCTRCSFKQIKSFAAGDYVSKLQGRCSQCGNESLFINGIYADEPRKRQAGLAG